MLPPQQRVRPLAQHSRRWRLIAIASLVLNLLLMAYTCLAPGAGRAGAGEPAVQLDLLTQQQTVGAGAADSTPIDTLFAAPSPARRPPVSRRVLPPARPTHSAVREPPVPASSLAVASPAAPAVDEPVDPLLFVIVSVTRPNGTDYASSLIASIFAGHHAAFPSSAGKLRVLLFDADLPSRRRPDSFFALLPEGVEVHRAPAAALAELATVDDNPARDRHHDPAERIRWRSKMSKDLECVLTLAAQQSSLGWPTAIVLQDDVQLSSHFFPRMAAILRSPAALDSAAPWLAWVLFHAAAFDHGIHYNDGDLYQFEACGQAIMYRTAALSPLIEWVRREWRHNPDDWHLRDYQRASNSLIRVAQPSIVQHIGAVSSLSSKAKEGGGIASGCWAPDFV